MTLKQGISKMKRQSIKLQREAVQAVAKTVDQGVTFAKKKSSGTKSLAQLRREGHPYSVRFAARSDDAIINAQTNHFKDRWNGKKPGGGPGTAKGAIVNDDPVARFLVGEPRPKSRMRVRPIDKVVEAKSEVLLRKNLDTAFRRATK